VFAVLSSDLLECSGDVDIQLPELMTDSELFINFYFTLKEEFPWAPKGHTLAVEQLQITRTDAKHCLPAPPTLPTAELKMRETDEVIEVTSTSLMIAVDKSRGALRSMKLLLQDGATKELLASAPEFIFHRAPVDNDRGGNKTSNYREWKAAGEIVFDFMKLNFVKVFMI
jgi:beta-galactosidase